MVSGLLGLESLEGVLTERLKPLAVIITRTALSTRYKNLLHQR
jgi:hypothetical protein